MGEFMAKRVSLQERVKKEKDSAEKFEQGFKTDVVSIATLTEPKNFALTDAQESQIKNLFIEYKSDDLNKEQINDDLDKALEISISIKTITQQSVLLIGERIKKAQHVMARYKVGMFNKWLLLIFGNKATPYNFLRFFNFYHSIEDLTIRNKLEELPKKAAYKLASRKGELSTKIEVLKSVTASNQNNKSIKVAILEKMIDQKFPIDESDNRTTINLKRKNPSKVRSDLIEHLNKFVEFSKILPMCPLADSDLELVKQASKILEGWSLELNS